MVGCPVTTALKYLSGGTQPSRDLLRILPHIHDLVHLLRDSSIRPGKDNNLLHFLSLRILPVNSSKLMADSG